MTILEYDSDIETPIGRVSLCGEQLQPMPAFLPVSIRRPLMLCLSAQVTASLPGSTPAAGSPAKQVITPFLSYMQAEVSRVDPEKTGRELSMVQFYLFIK